MLERAGPDDGAEHIAGPPERSKLCPTCHKRYRPEANYCPEDGSSLPELDPYIGSVLLGQIELQHVCGRGSMGTVYRAWQSTMERQVAVKILRPDLLWDGRVVKRFRREARAAARLSHPNIITLYLVGETDDGVPFIVMEYVDGCSLDDLCQREGAVPPARALHIARQIAAALAEAHAQQIVHRDLKPANILLADRRGAPDFVKILDFGIAKILRTADESQLTQTGAIFGTPYYLSPEQASGNDVDHRCDIYSLGVILFRLLTGRLPFCSSSGMEVLVQHIKDQPPRPRELVPALPDALEALVLRMLEKDPARRFQSADEAIERLEQLAEQLYGGGPTLVGVARDALPDATPPRAASRGRPAGPMSPAGPMTVAGSIQHRRPDADADAQTAATAQAPAPRGDAMLAGDRGQRTAAAESVSDAGSTAALLRAQLRRRRVLSQLLLALGCIVGGAAAGALLFHLAQRGWLPWLHEAAPRPASGAQADPLPAARAAHLADRAEPASAAANNAPLPDAGPAAIDAGTSAHALNGRRPPRRPALRARQVRRRRRPKKQPAAAPMRPAPAPRPRPDPAPVPELTPAAPPYAAPPPLAPAPGADAVVRSPPAADGGVAPAPVAPVAPAPDVDDPAPGPPPRDPTPTDDIYDLVD